MIAIIYLLLAADVSLQWDISTTLGVNYTIYGHTNKNQLLTNKTIANKVVLAETNTIATIPITPGVEWFFVVTATLEGKESDISNHVTNSIVPFPSTNLRIKPTP